MLQVYENEKAAIEADPTLSLMHIVHVYDMHQDGVLTADEAAELARLIRVKVKEQSDRT